MSAIVFLPLSQGKLAVIDFEDFDRLGRVKWCAINRGPFYAARRAGATKLYLHREVLSCPPGEIVDHINRDSLDNRRENLRRCSRLENNRNARKRRGGSSNFKGVFWNAEGEKWRASIQVSGYRIHIGDFACDLTAARAYDKLAREHFGEFACCNFPLNQQPRQKEQNESSIV